MTENYYLYTYIRNNTEFVTSNKDVAFIRADDIELITALLID